MQIREMPRRAVEKRKKKEDERNKKGGKREKENTRSQGGAGSARERNLRGSLITRHSLVIPSGSHVHRL